MAAAPDDTRWGTIFMGPTPDRESTIDKVTEDRQRELWNRRTEAEYMERVRAKATLRVQAMLDQARTQAEAIRGTARQWAEKLKVECEGLNEQARKTRQEAEALLAQAERERAAAREEGYRVGAEQALADLDLHRTALEDATASVLKTIEEQAGALFEAWRRDLAALTRDCVESLTGWVLTEERDAVLEGLLAAAAQELTERRRLEIRVNPADCEAVTLVIESAKARFPDVKHWEVRADETIGQGGLIVESASGMVDNRLEIRRQAVDDILRHLTLPAGPADAEALETVARQMESTGINALAAQSEERAALAAAEEARNAQAQEFQEEAAPEPGAEAGPVQDAAPEVDQELDLDAISPVSPDLTEPTDLAAPPVLTDEPVTSAQAEEPAAETAALPAALADQSEQDDDIPVLDVFIADADTADAPQPAPEAGDGAKGGAVPNAPNASEEVTPHGA